MSEQQREKFGAVLPIVLLGYFIILMDNSIVFTSSLSIARELGMAGVAGAAEDAAGAASGVVNVFHQIGAAIGLAAISLAVADFEPVATIDNAQGLMLALIVASGVCGLLVRASERHGGTCAPELATTE